MDTEHMKKQIEDAFKRAEKERKRKAFFRWIRGGEMDDEVRDLIKEVSEKAAAEQNEIIRKAKEIEDGKKSDL